MNDFSGQWGVVRNLLTQNGLIRLGISMTGKWFYMATVSGLVVCWGIFGLFRNAFTLFGESIRQRAMVFAGRRRYGAQDHLRKTDNTMFGDTDQWNAYGCLAYCLRGWALL